MKRILQILCVILCVQVLSCTQKEKTAGIKIDFWTAPERYNLHFWSEYAKRFNDRGFDIDGRPIVVRVQMMPAQPSSEAGIQSAAATGSLPVASENIQRGFARTLAQSGLIRNLADDEWFWDIARLRGLEETLAGWEIDGAQYVIPLYVNPLVPVYNSRALKALNGGEIPQTEADLRSLIAAFREKRADMDSIGVSHFLSGADIANPQSWWSRWADIESPHRALSGGLALVEGKMLTADAQALETIFERYALMGDLILKGSLPNLWQEAQIPVVMGFGEPWNISKNEAAGKVYGIEGDYVFGPQPVLHEGDRPYNYADSKGIVIYKHKNISEEAYEGLVRFLRFVFLEESDFDLNWLRATTMLPVRSDIASDPALQEFFAAHPALKDTAAYAKDSLPGMAHEKQAEILTALGQKGLEPLIRDTQGLKPVQYYVREAIRAMSEAGDLVYEQTD